MILISVFLGPILLAPAGHVPSILDSDLWMYYHPMADAAFGMLRAGQLPLWNPYLYSGMPLLASIEVGVFYPPNWLHLVLSTDRVFCVLSVFHILLAAVGMWCYVRGRGRGIEAALFSAMAFAFSAPLWLHIYAGMPTVVSGAAWIPLIFAGTDRCIKAPNFRSACLLALALACQFLAGFPMFTMVLAALIPAYLLVFGIEAPVFSSGKNLRVIACSLAAALLALGLVSPQLLPTLRYLDQSVRMALGYQEATHACFPLANLWTFFIPEFLGNDHQCLYWGQMFLCDVNGFCGITTLLLAIAAGVHIRNRETWFWAIAGILIAAVSLGKDSPIYDLCFLFVPGVERFRAVSRLMVFVDFALAILAGAGLEQLLTWKLRSRSVSRVAVATTAIASIGLATGVILWVRIDDAVPSWWTEIVDWVRLPGGEFYEPIAMEARKQALSIGYALFLRSAIFESAILVAAAAILLVCAGRASRRQLAGCCLLALLAIELAGFGRQFCVLTDTSEWSSIARKVKAALPAEDEPYRIAAFSEDPPLPLNRFIYGRLESVGGHENFVLERYGVFLLKCAGIELKSQTYLTVPNDGRLYDFLNVKYYLCPDDVQKLHARDELVQSDVFSEGGHDFALFRNSNVLPRANLVHEFRLSKSLNETAGALRGLWEGRLETDSIIEGDPDINPAALSASDRAVEHVEFVDSGPGFCTVDVRSAAPGMLVFIENYTPGWHARVDGLPVKVYPANVFMLAVPLTSTGRHRVELKYESEPLVRGQMFAAASLAVMIGGVLISGARTRYTLIRVQDA